ncbi:sugar transporter [Bradyrhizobium sp. SSBR45G]|uniref:polysaccharide biosynthesis/export family protein n=1 Tax=unclassified Bradyrhizobium TaxID=2631580 RepID=UPI00234290A5|nr:MULTISPECIES: polysaccharide biosynthesis/export family protein [unclassified Bradyrhizobium]GLH82295.1 sugar transporter [Bradyrhizobium sp. SSBR45G]GLH89701.1 sugar transporter [Bradyrhizobium sp. SSBR45R]
MRALLLPVIAVFSTILLSGCMHTASPVAVGQPQSDLDTMAYGIPSTGPVAATGQGGAIPALRDAFAAAPRGAYVIPAGYAPGRNESAYHLDAGDKLRVVVYGQEGLTNTYAIDASGSITMPLIGSVPARGRTTAGLAAEITAKLRNGYIREPSVAVEIEAYRPFFILGEVQAPGQYPYVPNMTVESAIAIAGGFSPRARRDIVILTHTDPSGAARYEVPLGTSLKPGDTIQVGERWF